MKRAVITAVLVLAALVPVTARAASWVRMTQASAAGGPSYTLIFAGEAGPNEITISLSRDGATYSITSNGPLQASVSICRNSAPNALDCDAPEVRGFWVNGLGGDDSVLVGSTVPVPVTLRGGPGTDILIGGEGNDLLVGGEGTDRLIGRAGDDVLKGGPGADVLVGGRGNDVLVGGPGRDLISGGPGHNRITQ